MYDGFQWDIKMTKAKFSKSTCAVYPISAYKDFPPDALDIPAALYARFQSGEISAFDVDNGKVIERAPPVQSDENIVATLTAEVQRHLDDTAKAAGYDTIYTAISYAEEPAVPKFQTEGRALRAWRSIVWERCNEVMAEVQDGERDVPSTEELISLLPEFKL